VGADRVHAHRPEIVDGRTETDRLGDGRCAGLEAPGDVVGDEPVLADVEDHLPPAEEGGHVREQILAAPQHTDAGGPEHLVRAERQEVGAQGGHVGG
jgi:hypothetical protein